MRKRSLSREYALQILYAVNIRKNDQPHYVQEVFWQNHADEASEVKDFAQTLVQGTVSRLDEIDPLISRYADNWRLDRMAVIDRNILRMATYELLFLPDIPPKVTINEAVEMAKKFGDEESGRFVNGILDKINKEECKKQL
ncbi:MAG: transcription antitermination factor NusB [Candidatus Omnitrophica bacterium]|nr:transcription antitermination factor NusB [Candidatus Omnitrophota bacterium]